MAKGWGLSTGNLPHGGLPRNSVDRITDRPDMTSAVDRGLKALTQQHNNIYVEPQAVCNIHVHGRTLHQVSYCIFSALHLVHLEVSGVNYLYLHCAIQM